MILKFLIIKKSAILFVLSPTSFGSQLFFSKQIRTLRRSIARAVLLELFSRCAVACPTSSFRWAIVARVFFRCAFTFVARDIFRCAVAVFARTYFFVARKSSTFVLYVSKYFRNNIQVNKFWRIPRKSHWWCYRRLSCRT